MCKTDRAKTYEKFSTTSMCKQKNCFISAKIPKKDKLSKNCIMQIHVFNM